MQSSSRRRYLRASSASGVVVVRDVCAADLDEVQRIYAHYVATSPSTFAYEGEAPTLAEWEERWLEGTAKHYPWLVAVAADSGMVVGYAYTGPFRPRRGWRFAAEHSVYAAPDYQRAGVGRALLEATVERCRSLGLCTLIAVISTTADGVGAASVGLHGSMGWEHWATLPGIGVKGGRVLDCTFMTLTLNHLTAELEGADVL